MDFDLDRQRRFLHTMADQWKDEYEAFPREAEDRSTGDGFYLNQGLFGAVDAEMLYSVVRSARPKTVVEIGGGWTSQLISDALELNGAGKLITIEQDPNEGLRKVKNIDLRAVPVVGAGGRVFSELEDGDVLSIDGSHVMGEKSDVALYLEYFLPSLKPGVLVQVHDIFLPDAYPKAFQARGYDEQDHLAVFLNGHPEWKIEFAANWFSKQQPEELNKAFSSFESHRTPGSMWLRKDLSKPTIKPMTKTKKLKKKTVNRSFTMNAAVEGPHEFRVNRGGVNCIDCGKPEEEGTHE